MMVIFTRCLLVHMLLIISGVYYSAKAYNPLDPQKYKNYQQNGWYRYETEGPLSASITYFTPEDEEQSSSGCVLVVVFKAHSVILDFLQTECETDPGPYPPSGIFYQEPILRYYHIAMLKQVEDRRFLLIKREEEENKCTTKTFDLILDDPSRPVLKNTEVSSATNCNVLNKLPAPPMYVLSPNGGVGKFKPVNPDDLWTFNAWEPVGYMTQEYQHQGKCFRLLVIVSTGRMVKALKLNCGPVSSVTSLNDGLLLGNTLYVTKNNEDKFTILINTRNKGCVRKVVSFETTDEGWVRKIIEDEVVNPVGNDCEKLVKGTIINRVAIEKLKSKLPKDVLDYTFEGEYGIMVYKDEYETNVYVVPLVIHGLASPDEITLEAVAPKKKDITVNSFKVAWEGEFSFSKDNTYYELLFLMDPVHCQYKKYTVKPYSGREQLQFEDVSRSANNDINNSAECIALKKGVLLKPDTNSVLPENEIEKPEVVPSEVKRGP